MQKRPFSRSLIAASMSCFFAAVTAFAPAASGAVTAVIAVTPSPTQPAAGQAVSVTATLTGSAGTPTGFVILVIDNVADVNAYPLVAGAYTFTPTQVPALGTLTPGNHAFQVEYSGDANYFPQLSGTTPITVSKPAPTGTLSTNPPSPVALNSAVTLRVVMATSLAAVPTGTFSVYDGSTLIASPAVAGITTDIALPASVTQTSGSHTLTVQYSGDINYSGFATNPSTVLVVNAALVPVPPSVFLTLTGLAGVGLLFRRRLAPRV